MRDDGDHAALLDATDDWLRRAMAAKRRRPRRADDSPMTLAIYAVKELVRAAPDDRKGPHSPPVGPLEEAECGLNRSLVPHEVAMVVLALLGARPQYRCNGLRPPPSPLMAGLVRLLLQFPRASPWDLGLAYVMGWRRDAGGVRDLREVFPLAVGATEQLLVESVVTVNDVTVCCHMLWSARLEPPGSVGTMARWMACRLSGADCACGHHSRHLGCRRGAQGLGTSCRRACCRHTWSAFQPSEPLGRFTARMVGGDTLLHKRPRKDFGGTLFVQAVTDPDLRDALLWRLPNGDVTPLEVCLGDVQFNVCHRCAKRYECNRCPQCATAFDPVHTERLVRPGWLFARRIEHLFEYEIGWLSECACGAPFAPEQLGRTCHRCSRPLRPSGDLAAGELGTDEWRQVWVKRLTGRRDEELLT